MIRQLWSSLVSVILRPRWVVNLQEGDCGLRIWGVNLWYYKWPEPMIAPEAPWRYADKREFGEVVRSLKHAR